MSTTYINAELRRLVTTRANSKCEYCQIREADSYWGCHVDHIISEKHGGETTAENLAFACATCNRNKGSNVGSVVPNTSQFVRFFNPRVDSWSDNFRLDGITIVPTTDIGEATVRILGFNSVERLLERQELIELSRYP